MVVLDVLLFFGLLVAVGLKNVMLVCVLGTAVMMAIGLTARQYMRQIYTKTKGHVESFKAEDITTMALHVAGYLGDKRSDISKRYLDDKIQITDVRGIVVIEVRKGNEYTLVFSNREQIYHKGYWVSYLADVLFPKAKAIRVKQEQEELLKAERRKASREAKEFRTAPIDDSRIFGQAEPLFKNSL